MKTKITLTVEIEHTKNVSKETIEELLFISLKEGFYTNDLEVTGVEFCENKVLEALKTLLSSYKADFKNITGSELNNTEAVKKAKAVIANFNH